MFPSESADNYTMKPMLNKEFRYLYILFFIKVKISKFFKFGSFFWLPLIGIPFLELPEGFGWHSPHPSPLWFDLLQTNDMRERERKPVACLSIGQYDGYRKIRYILPKPLFFFNLHVSILCLFSLSILFFILTLTMYLGDINA